MPETRLSLAIPALQVAGLAEAAVETQVVTDAVLPAVGSRLEEGEVLSEGNEDSQYVNGGQAPVTHILYLKSADTLNKKVCKWYGSKKNLQGKKCR